MDPNDRLIQRLAQELRQSTAAMRLRPESRADLKARMLATTSCLPKCVHANIT